MGRDLPGGWREVPLSDVIDFREGPGILARDFRDEGVPLIRLSGLLGGSLLAGCNYLDPSKVETKWAHFRVECGDTLLSTSASLGRVARVDTPAAGAIPYTGIIRMRPRGGALLPEYVSYVLRDASFERQVRAMGAGSVMQHFGPSHLRQMTVIVPPHDDQAAIVAVLGALDRKVHSDGRLARALDAVAGGFAYDWLDRRPGRIPVSSVADVIIGGTPSRGVHEYWADGSIAWVASKEVNRFRIDAPSECISVEGFARSAAKMLPRGTPVVAITGATCGKVSRLEIEACTNQSVVGLVGGAAAPPDLLYFWLRRSIPALMQSATGAAQQHVSKRDVAALPYPDAAPSDVAEVAATIAPLMEACGRAVAEARTVRAMHDALLPRLLTGQIRVPLSSDPEEQVGAAVEALA